MLFVDLSSNNRGPRNFAAARSAGIDGAIIKATQATRYVSPTFGSDYTAARAAGLVVGAYHFWDPSVSWKDQLEWFFSHYGPVPGDFPAVIDAEINPTGRGWDELRNEAEMLLAACAARYGDAWIYMNRNWATNLRITGHGVWLAQGAPGPVTAAEAQQFAPVSIPGLSGPVDWSHTNWRQP